MTLIDQRILIPAPMQAVWQVIADYKQLTQWRTDIANVLILSTRPDGQGARRRITLKDSRKDTIEEVSVWYEGVGYEYHLIEGNPFKSFTARLRLQGTPDGTIVQWTISFQPRGILGWLIGNPRQRKRLERIVVDSLRQLRRHVEQQGVSVDSEYREKNRIKDRINADSRAEYGAKLVAIQQMEDAAETSTSADTSGPIITEPPLRLDDTPSVPRVVPPSFLAEALKTSEISVAEDVKQDTRPTTPIVPDDVSITPSPVQEAIASLKEVSDTPENTPKTDTKPKRPAGLDEAIASTSAPLSTEAKSVVDESKVELPPPATQRDTGQVSIWEVFGVNRPKDELSSIIDELKTPDTEKPSPSTPLETSVDASQSPPPPEKRSNLETWLAANEPPLPASASSNISTIARPPNSLKGGLRKQQRQKNQRLRRPSKSE